MKNQDITKALTGKVIKSVKISRDMWGDLDSIELFFSDGSSFDISSLAVAEACGGGSILCLESVTRKSNNIRRQIENNS